MDLRNHISHLHYIHVIKKGTVVELMNQSPSGVPARKFRDISDIYDDEDSKCDISLAGHHLRNKSSGSVDDCSKEGMKILICSPSASLWNDPPSDEAACDTIPDNIFSDELTLQQLLENCNKKGRKRKTPESDYGIETSTSGKEHLVSRPRDDLSDLLLPLSCLMSNLRNKKRVNVVEDPDSLLQSRSTVLDLPGEIATSNQGSNMVTVPDACLHALSSSVDPISNAHGNSEPGCIENELDPLGGDNLVESVVPSDRSAIKKENENLLYSGGSCQSFQTGQSHLPLSEVNVHEDTSMASLLDIPSDALTSAVNRTSDNNDPMDMYNDYHMNPAAQIYPVKQQIDDRLVASPGYEVNTMGDCLHMVKENTEGAETSNPRVSLIKDSMESRCQSASSTASCYSDSAVPTNHTGRDDELPSVTSCSIIETSNSMSPGSCGSIDEPFAPPERSLTERKASSLALQNDLWEAMENIDTIDSREKLRYLGKLVSDNQFKHKKRSTVKGNEIKGSGQVNKSDMSKQSGSKSTGSAHEHKHSGIKTARLPSSLGSDTKRGQCIPSSPEGAILFSKKQMQDFEALAKKLTSELASMKGIVEERLNHEAGTPDHNNDQVITAINKASKAEQTARKRLSTMNRDCIRFCTIMKTSEDNNKDTSNSGPVPQKKEKRKIKFADEAGGELCQIKFFESDEVRAPADV